MMRWLLPVALVMALAGYLAPWIAHPVAGLVITGLDLGEYVKFLPVVREGAVALWRPGFYVPLVAVSAASLLAAYRNDFAYRRWLRLPLLALATVAALNLVPPAWTPTRLLEPEFRLQTASLLCLLAGIAFSPFLALLPRRAAATIVAGLALLGCFLPVYGFYQVLPEIQALYNQPLALAWGPWLMVLGLVLTSVAYWSISTRPSLSR
jgi:hypothetical protein